jgi:hypothetical protein
MVSCNLKLVRERHVSRRDASSIALWLSSVAAHVCRDVGVVVWSASKQKQAGVFDFLCSFAGSLSVILLGVFFSGSAKCQKPVCC